MVELPRLPNVDDVASYERLWVHEEPWRPFVTALARSRGLHDEPERYGTGTAVAYRLGELVLKLYPPIAAGDADVEGHVLGLLAQVSDVPSPQLIAQGRQGDWTYLLMTRLPGTPIEQGFHERPAQERIDLARQAGAITRTLHAQRSDAVPRVDGNFDEYRTFRRGRALAHHLERGFPEARSGELEALLTDLDGEPEPDSRQVLLHTELGPGHFLVEGARISGLFDFAEARAGLPEYDFAAVGLFVTRGDRAAFTAFLDAYGVPRALRGRPLVRRVLRHALLHQYGHLSLYFRASAVPCPDDLWAAAEYWFGHDG